MFKQPKYRQIPRQVPAAVQHSAVTQKMHFAAKQAFGDGQDQTLLWKADIPISPLVRKRMLVFKNVDYVISNWAEDQYPLVIYISVDGINGYLDKMMNPSTRLAALQLSDVAAILDNSGIRTYELKYLLKDSSFWEIPSNMTELKVRVRIDEQGDEVVLPLPNPLLLNVQVRSE